VNEYLISSDRERINLDLVHDYLSCRSYWARGRSRESQRQANANSLCFGAYAPGGEQVGFARVVTDYTTFAWICDLFVLEPHQGRGLGKALVQAVVEHPELQGLKRLLLATRDAHELYRRHGGFTPLAAPESWMERSTQS
jgi:GNAT superfamily N-acetyltransferase